MLHYNNLFVLPRTSQTQVLQWRYSVIMEAKGVIIVIGLLNQKNLSLFSSLSLCHNIHPSCSYTKYEHCTHKTYTPQAYNYTRVYGEYLSENNFSCFLNSYKKTSGCKPTPMGTNNEQCTRLLIFGLNTHHP